jgi:Golgi SNAP receptor complex protein 2
MAATAVTLSDLYQQSRHCLLRVRDGLERLERLENTNGAVGPDLAQGVQQDLAQLQSGTLDMERLWHQLPASQRGLWKRKVEQVAEESNSLKLSLEKYLGRQRRRQVEAQEREDLMKRLNGDSASVLQVYDEEAQVMQSVQNSSRMLEDAFAAGTAVLAKYADQRDRLKAAQRKALDVLNTVGLSNSVLRVIERRHRLDKWISYGGIVLTIIIVIVVWRWVKG